MVSFRVTEKVFSNGAARASIVEDLVTTSHVASVEGLREDVSAADDVVSRLPLYESELMHVEGVITSAWEPAAREHHYRARLATAGVPMSHPTSCGLWVRLPVPRFDVTGYRIGCTLRLDGVMWRFNADAQFTSYVPAEVSVTCP